MWWDDIMHNIHGKKISCDILRSETPLITDAWNKNHIILGIFVSPACKIYKIHFMHTGRFPCPLNCEWVVPSFWYSSLTCHFMISTLQSTAIARCVITADATIHNASVCMAVSDTSSPSRDRGIQEPSPHGHWFCEFFRMVRRNTCKLLQIWHHFLYCSYFSACQLCHLCTALR